MTNPWTPDKEALTNMLTDVPEYRLTQLWQGLYGQGKTVSEISNLPKDLKGKIADKLPSGLKMLTEKVSSDDNTVKWLWGLSDEATIETVLMHYDNRSTVCVSSQAGCAMGCGFCATGQAGYERNLEAGEILEQVATAKASAMRNDRRLSNVVFMGMGEPFANYPNLLIAVRRIINDFEIGARHITVSTVGLVPQILKFAEEGLQVGLAISLHAANDKLRSELVPINKRHPLKDLVAACQLYKEKTNRRVSFEWAMIDQTNDSEQDAHEFADIALKCKAHVNLIPLNPTPVWPTVGSDADTVEEFANTLRSRGVNTTVRANRGTDIDAACGQLKTSYENRPVELKPSKPSQPRPQT